MRLILRRVALALVLGALGSSSSAGAEAGDDQFALAADHYSHERWQEACDAFGSLLAVHPNHARANQARFFYGEALAQLNRLDLSRAQFAELLKRDPEHRYARQALFRGGEAAYLAGDEKAAKRDLGRFRERYPRDELNGFALPYLASLELQAGNAAAAQRLFSAALEEFEKGPLADDCRLGLARAQEVLGQLERARLGYRAIVEGTSPRAGEAALRLGMLENALGEHARALATLERLDTSAPVGPLQDKCRLGRGYALYQLGRYAECEEVLAGLLARPTLGIEAHYWQGMSQKARRQWSAAAQTLSAGAKLDQEHRLAPALAFHAADAQLEAGQHLAAREGFDRALARWPRGPWADDYLLGTLRVAAAREKNADCARLADELMARFPDSPLRPLAEVAKGRSLFAMGEYTQAADALERVAKQALREDAPGHEHLADVQNLLALCYARLGRWAEANRLSAAPRGEDASARLAVETRCQVAESAYAAGKLDVARDLFARLIADKVSSEATRRGLSGLAWCEFKSKRWASAAEAFEALASEFPDAATAPEAALMRASALEHLEQLEQSLASYRLLIERYATSDRAAEALWRAALLHEKLGQNEQALDLYGQLTSGHADFADLDAAIYRRAWLLRQAGKGEAGELFARVRREFPASRYAADATLRLADAAIANQRFDEAQKLLTEITRPETTEEVLEEAWYLQGRMALVREQWDAVEAPLAQLIERFPRGQWARSAAYLRGEASYRQGKYEQAVERLSELAASTSDRPEPWSALAELRRAQALAQLNEWSQALEVSRAIAKRFENFDRQHEVDYLIGRALAAQADFAAAREAFARVIESPRGRATQTAARAQWMIGESYFHQENYQAALAEYAKLDERHPFPRWQTAGLLQAGKCHEHLGQWQLAVDLYDRLLKTHPTSEFCDEATRRLAAAQERLAGGASTLK
jgi:TolA-binding protein